MRSNSDIPPPGEPLSGVPHMTRRSLRTAALVMAAAVAGSAGVPDPPHGPGRRPGRKDRRRHQVRRPREPRPQAGARAGDAGHPVRRLDVVGRDRLPVRHVRGQHLGRLEGAGGRPRRQGRPDHPPARRPRAAPQGAGDGPPAGGQRRPADVLRRRRRDRGHEPGGVRQGPHQQDLPDPRPAVPTDRLHPSPAAGPAERHPGPAGAVRAAAARAAARACSRRGTTRPATWPASRPRPTGRPRSSS